MKGAANSDAGSDVGASADTRLLSVLRMCSTSM